MFGFGHMPMVKLSQGIFRFIIPFAGILSAFFFPYIILNFKYGFIYTYIIHLLFYTNTGLLFWLIKSRKSKEIGKKVFQESEKIINEIKGE